MREVLREGEKGGQGVREGGQGVGGDGRRERKGRGLRGRTGMGGGEGGRAGMGGGGQGMGGGEGGKPCLTNSVFSSSFQAVTKYFLPLLLYGEGGECVIRTHPN